MEQLIEFASNHIYLFIALAVVSALLVHNLVSGMDSSSILPQQATELINREDAVIVDVRPMADYASGHIINAINLPMNGFQGQINRLEKYKQRPVILTCRSGAQSSGAAKLLKKAGFEKVFNLKGGILAWQNASLPVSRKK